MVEIACGLTWAGRITLNDEPKEFSALAVSRLRSLGIADIVMLTGDTEAAAAGIAGKIGIDDFRSGVLPHQKVACFEEISKRVKARNAKATVLFVGDGINDAPVLSLADAGIAMGGIGSDAAIEAADVVLMNDNPLSVAEAIRVRALDPAHRFRKYRAVVHREDRLSPPRIRGNRHSLGGRFRRRGSRPPRDRELPARPDPPAPEAPRFTRHVDKPAHFCYLSPVSAGVVKW